MELETQAAFDPASFEHIPVLLNECLEGLAIDPAGTYLDGTAGGAGHSRQIALRLDAEKGGRLISLDQDPDAVQTGKRPEEARDPQPTASQRKHQNDLVRKLNNAGKGRAGRKA